MNNRQALPGERAPDRVRAGWITTELTLEEMLADPIIRARMAADGVRSDAVRQVIKEARQNYMAWAA